jgi:hypothetical protein
MRGNEWGLYSRVKQKLGLSGASFVSRVDRGLEKSARVEKALAAERARMRKRKAGAA